VHASRLIHADIGGLARIRCDQERIAQLLSNLVSNAITHGACSGPVVVKAYIEQYVFKLSVTNQGEPIPADVLPQLFMPYSRPVTDMPQAGLGLGLYIASQIAQAHGGRLDVVSTWEQGTTFTFAMPL